MADYTLLSTQVASGVQPREVHVGVNYAFATYSLTATLSLTAVIHMVKIPDRARVLEVLE